MTSLTYQSTAVVSMVHTGKYEPDRLTAAPPNPKVPQEKSARGANI